VDGRAREVACPFCARSIVVPPEVLSRLASYRVEAGAVLAQAEGQRRIAAQWRSWTSSASSATHFIVPTVLLVVAPIVLLACGVAAIQVGLVPHALEDFLPIVFFAPFLVGLVVYIAWYVKHLGTAAATRGTGAGSMACPSCGAPNELTPERPVGACRYCHAPLLPSPTILRDLLAEAEIAARRARMERYRAERSGMAYYQSTSAASWAAYIAPLSLLVPLAIGTVYFSVGMIAGSEKYEPTIFLGWALTLGGAALLAWFHTWRRDRRARLQRAVETVIRGFGGARLPDHRAAIGWLNTYWAGPLLLEDLYAGASFEVAAGRVGDYPVLIWVDPVPLATDFEAKILLLVAAAIPGAERGREGGSLALATRSLEARRALEETGLVVEANEGGLLARAPAGLVRRIRWSPEDALRLAPALAAMVRLAMQLGAPPVQAIP
jgi:hypothetical protein